MSDWASITAANRPAKNSAQATASGATRQQSPSWLVARLSAASTAVRTLPVSEGMAIVAAVSLYCLVVAMVFFSTLASMVTIWLRSQTFAHGFLILPISLWLVWHMRDRFTALRVKPEPWAVLPVLASGLVWLLGFLVDVQVIQHLAFVAVLVSGIWVIVGTQVARCYAFPLGFLFLAVPMGAGLIPPLMEFTADTTEFLIRASGIPVFREGMYLSLPTSTWSVIEECSGVRYLIASFTLGLFYAHLTYHSLWRRAAFMVAAIIVPILANSVRAYGVVMVGHLSDLRYGIGADHLIYGWVFFGLVMFLMFWIGGFWQQSALPAASDASGAMPLRSKPALSLILGTCLALVCAGLWPVLALATNRNDEPVNATALAIPATLGTWQATSMADWPWRPGQVDADRELDQKFIATDTPAATPPAMVGLHVRQYLQQQQGAELVSSTDPWRPDRRDWRVMAQGNARVDMGLPVNVDEVRVVSARQHLLVWSWYRVDGRNTANPYIAKLLEAKQQLVTGRRLGARIFIATPVGQEVGEDYQQARAVLQDFVSVYGTAIDAALEAGTGPIGAGSEPGPVGTAQ